MTTEAKIARQIYDEFRIGAVASRSRRVPLRIDQSECLWPDASSDRLFLAHLIAYELLINDVKKAISRLDPTVPPAQPS